ncbi:MAG TPA: alpha/beta hydrolase, partial [Paenarthrobacter sp.]|nr:alpha/beta hydrolase [Paenarthrobacter sp.]
LYDPHRLATNTIPVAAAVYKDDIYVDHDLSMETAAAVRGLQPWVTDEFHHDGIGEDGEGIFRRLFGLVRGSR